MATKTKTAPATTTTESELATSVTDASTSASDDALLAELASASGAGGEKSASSNLSTSSNGSTGTTEPAAMATPEVASTSEPTLMPTPESDADAWMSEVLSPPDATYVVRRGGRAVDVNGMPYVVPVGLIVHTRTHDVSGMMKAGIDLELVPEKE